MSIVETAFAKDSESLGGIIKPVIPLSTTSEMLPISVTTTGLWNEYAMGIIRFVNLQRREVQRHLLFERVQQPDYPQYIH